MGTGAERDDAIEPPLAATPGQLCRLIADALGDGDLAAALSYYEPDAVHAGLGRRPAAGRGEVEQALARVVNARLAIEIQVQRVLSTGSTALIRATWMTQGAGPDGAPYRRSGTVRSISRLSPDGGWRVAVEELDSKPSPGQP
ncbi:MAG: nuclear transport factor 2 family protein [Actinobacteria bacterium]|nr:nuclear transport factor 2 family protein [Actinomycetota bacterium]